MLTIYNQRAEIDLAPLRELPALTMLDISLTKVRNVDALAAAARLESLELLAAGVTDISFAAKVERLETITVQDNDVSDISPLARLPNLNDVDFTALPIDETALADFVSIPKWTHLGIGRTRVASLAFVAPALELVALDAEGCKGIRDLTPLARATKLRQLRLNGTSVADLKPLGATDLRELWLYDTPVDDVAPLKHLPLWGLGLSGTKVTDVTPLLELPNMRDTILLPAGIPDDQLHALQEKHKDARITRDPPPTIADVLSTP